MNGALAGGASLEVVVDGANMKVLGAAEGAGAGAAEVLLALPKRLGAGMELDAALVELVGLLAMKEKAGFGAAGESVERRADI